MEHGPGRTAFLLPKPHPSYRPKSSESSLTSIPSLPNYESISKFCWLHLQNPNTTHQFHCYLPRPSHQLSSILLQQLPTGPCPLQSALKHSQSSLRHESKPVTFCSKLSYSSMSEYEVPPNDSHHVNSHLTTLSDSGLLPTTNLWPLH